MENRAGESPRPVVLIADDDGMMRALVAEALARQGIRVVVADDGRDAMERLERDEIDLALLDLNMPVLDGLGTLREIRANARYRTLPVILMTASDDESTRVRGLEGGADDYLAKPVSLTELVARIRAHLRGRSIWARELERGREERRRLAAVLDRLPRSGPLVVLAARLLEEVRPALEIDGAAILHFGAGLVRTIAATGDLAPTYRPGKVLARDRGREIARRAESGAWVQGGEDSGDDLIGAEASEVAFVPFRLGPTPKPLGCLAYSVRRRGTAGPLAGRLPDLVDATDFIVAVLRPATEEAEVTGAATTRLRRVIARQEFEIHFQPIVELERRKVVAVEALARFGEGIRPDLQFAEAASLGLGRELERATLAAAVAASESLASKVSLSVNLSADVLQHEPSLPEIVADARRPVIVEITEHERIEDYDAVRAAVDRLGRNVKLAVDDAGSGYASLRHILALRPAYVKLDIEWVHNIDRDPIRRSLVSGLTYFASETGSELIAEGIETEAELGVLRELGVTLGQGFLLGSPMPVRPAA